METSELDAYHAIPQTVPAMHSDAWRDLCPSYSQLGTAGSRSRMAMIRSGLKRNGNDGMPLGERLDGAAHGAFSGESDDPCALRMAFEGALLRLQRTFWRICITPGQVLVEWIGGLA